MTFEQKIRFLMRHGLDTNRHVLCLRFIAANNGKLSSLHEMAKFIEGTKTAATNGITALSIAGLATRVRYEKDKRRIILSLTKAGIGVMRTMDEVETA